MNRIGYVAFNTFREAVRDRVLYNLIAFALLLSGAAVLVGEISIDIERLVVVNLGLTAVSLFGVVIAIFMGIGLVSKEIEKKTLYTVLSRPVRRWEFVVGKFFGLTGTLVVNTFFMAIGVFLALLYVAHKFERADVLVLLALYFIVLEFFVVCALALFFSSFSTPIMSAVFTFALFVIGSLADDLRNFARITQGAAGVLAKAIAYLVPNFSAFNIINQAAHGAACPGPADSVQHGVRAALFGDGHLGSGADLPAPELEMIRTGRVTLVAMAVLLVTMAGGVAMLFAIDRMHIRAGVAAGALHPVAESAAAFVPWLHRPAGRHLLDARGAVLRRAASQGHGRFSSAGAAAPGNGRTRSAHASALSVRGEFLGTAAAEWRGPAGRCAGVIEIRNRA